MNHAELCERARRWLEGRGRCAFALVEFTTQLSEIADAIGFRRSGRESVLIECKASRSDFLKDKKKPHRAPGQAALGAYRYYMCEPGVINVTDLPERWGLLWVRGARVEIVAGADPDRCYWPPDTDVWRWHDAIGEHVLMFSAMRRMQLALGAAEFRKMVHTTFAEKQKVA